jgi:hypothetical protein
MAGVYSNVKAEGPETKFSLVLSNELKDFDDSYNGSVVRRNQIKNPTWMNETEH